MSWMDRVRRVPVRSLAFAGGIAVLAVAISLVNFSPSLRHLDVTVLSGSAQGNYHAVVARLAAAAERRKGRIENRVTSGTVDNLRRLAAAADGCEVQFALAQDGVPAPDGAELEVLARLTRTESVFVVGRDAERLTRFAEMTGMRIGIGPERSGTDYLARAIFETDDFRPLGLRLENHPVEHQLDLVAGGQLDLGVFVMDENAALMREAVRDRGIQLASLEHLAVIADRFDFLSHGRIAAGQYDPVRVLPPVDRPVLRVNTLLVGNGCASRTDIIGLLSVMTETMPGFLDRNKTGGGGGGFPRSEQAKAFFANDGPGWTDTYLPTWLIDLMPLNNWVYVVMAISLLFNALSGWHRLRLWRIDANRDRAHQIVRDVLGERLTPAEIHALAPAPKLRTDQALAQLDGAMADLDALRIKCRKQQNSILVPMGAEWIYRYEEEQMEQVLTALRAFRERARATAS
jgi:TRAP-type uncharacterized transport system substrate-binding protein